MSIIKLARFAAMFTGCTVVLTSINPSFAQSTPDYLTAAIKKKPVDYSEEQNLGASCSSRGQVCDNSVIYNVRPSQNHNLIKLTAPSTHCSMVYYFVEDTNNPNHFISSAQLSPGKTKSVNVGLLAKGSTPVKVTFVLLTT